MDHGITLSARKGCPARLMPRVRSKGFLTFPYLPKLEISSWPVRSTSTASIWFSALPAKKPIADLTRPWQEDTGSASKYKLRCYTGKFHQLFGKLQIFLHILSWCLPSKMHWLMTCLNHSNCYSSKAEISFIHLHPTIGRNIFWLHDAF